MHNCTHMQTHAPTHTHTLTHTHTHSHTLTCTLAGVVLWEMCTGGTPWLAQQDGSFAPNPTFPRMPEAVCGVFQALVSR